MISIHQPLHFCVVDMFDFCHTSKTSFTVDDNASLMNMLIYHTFAQLAISLSYAWYSSLNVIFINI
ncbi:hypothetical protein Avbf_03527 [Armadillidium vulgare]|nr:hypothetical protein Avbf_03527 [Armadillidium vulgare]